MKMFTHQFGLKAISIVIAFALWILVFGSRTIEVTKEVALDAVMDVDQMLVDPLPEKVTYKVSGPKAFLRSISNRLDEPVKINLKGTLRGTSVYRLTPEHFKLPSGVKIISIQPSTLSIRLEEIRRKSLPIKLETTGVVAAGYRVARTEVLPGQLKVLGPKGKLNHVNFIQNNPIDLATIRETQVFPLSFDFRSYGMEPDGPIPEVMIEVQAKGQAFRVRHVPLQLKSNTNASIVEEEVTVLVRTDIGDSVRVEGEQIRAEVDAADFQPGEYWRWVKVILPEKVRLVKVIPSMVRVQVRKP